MLSVGVLAFAAPWALAALAALAVIWWLLRLTPPSPQQVRFPPVRLLLVLMAREESKAKSPLWLLLLRLVLATLIILAAAHPLLHAGSGPLGTGPIVLFIDDSWAAARDWTARQTTIANLLDQAERQGRPVVVATTAPAGNEGRVEVSESVDPATVVSAEQARALLRGLQPKPWPSDRSAAVARLLATPAVTEGPPGHVVWISDGLDSGDSKDIVDALQKLGTMTVYAEPAAEPAALLRPPEPDGAALSVEVARSTSDGPARIGVAALGEDGSILARQDIVFADGEKTAQGGFTLPTELRNRLASMRLENESTAGAVTLIDERWRRRPVGLVSAQGSLAEQPLLGDQYYLERALNPFTEVRKGTVAELLERSLAVLILADPGRLDETDSKRLEQWMNDGGVTVRFAGPRLSQESDGLLPVALRGGDRIIGGALAWGAPATLAPIEESSPLFGLSTETKVRFRRHVLAEPSLDLAEKTWAKLSDGTPLVTADRRGKGWLILVHTTANAEWSDLALTGFYVEMLRKFVELGRGVAGREEAATLAPYRTLDGFGRLSSPPASALPISSNAVEETPVGPDHPPGYYGAEDSRRALNLSATLPAPEPLPTFASGVTREAYGTSREADLRPWFFLGALILALVDLIASLGLRHMLYLPRAAALALLLLPLAPDSARAQAGADEFALSASLQTRLAYIITGNEEVDETSRAGLWGLGVIVSRRTAAEMADPIGINPAQDDLSFFPLIYWPITGTQSPLSPVATDNLNRFMRNGGTIIFDTRDRDGGENSGALRELSTDLDLPSLMPIPPDHVLGRSYYLLREYPGRYTGGQIWVERSGERVNDGVSSVIVSPNDWAASWAMDPGQRPLYAVVPGGERQREWSYRVGINILMYTLTGNYKADQVHLPAIINRIGQ